jgi:hypothetical protein
VIKEVLEGMSIDYGYKRMTLTRKEALEGMTNNCNHTRCCVSMMKEAVDISIDYVYIEDVQGSEEVLEEMPVYYSYTLNNVGKMGVLEETLDDYKNNLN